jgi:hypothetical protein
MSISAEELDLLPYRDANLGRLFTKDCKENVRLFIKEFKESEVGARLVSGGLAYGANLDAILEATQAKFDREEVTLPEFTLIARQLWMIGELKKKSVEPTSIDNTPRDKNGKPLSESQLRWSEYRQFSESHSSSECRARARTDSGYRDFLHTNLVREFADQPVGDAVVAIGTQAVRQDKTRVTQDLREFAQAYRLAPTSEVKKLMSAATNPNGFVEYRTKLDAAIAAGLL